MNKQQVLNSNSIGKIQNLLRDSLHKGLDPLIPCIEFLKIPRQFRDDKVINMIVTILKKFKPFTSFLNIANEDELKKLLYEFALNGEFEFLEDYVQKFFIYDFDENLIAGSLDFDISKLEKLKYLDLSENQIDDIENLI